MNNNDKSLYLFLNIMSISCLVHPIISTFLPIPIDKPIDMVMLSFLFASIIINVLAIIVADSKK